nr:hypothetical protein 26 [bacterium]
MLLRPRQETFVSRCLKALEENGNTLGIAPTGAGKSVILSATAGNLLTSGKAGKALVLAHRDELTAQNRHRFSLVNKNVSTSIFDASKKDFSGSCVFAMVQTLGRHFEKMPKFDLLVIDEAHHASANIYQNIIKKGKELNPDLKLFGVTATPIRSDKKSLRQVFDNCADRITLKELIESGHLVPPKSFVINVGVQEDLRQVRKTASDFDMDAVEKIMDKEPVTDAVIRHWKEKAGDRQTVVFCSTVSHAEHVYDAFKSAGIKTVIVTGKTSNNERATLLKSLETGKAQVLVNVAVATEGWDCPPVSCVVLLRPCSHQSTMIQMIGRGLRIIDAEKYPGIIKTDCIVLDFGTSLITHGSLEAEMEKEREKQEREAGYKACLQCGARIVSNTHECPLCGYVFEKEIRDGESEKGVLEDFGMTEIDLLNKSPFAWQDIFGDGCSLIASGFDAWAGIFFKDSNWYALGSSLNEAKLLTVGTKTTAMAAADDWMNTYETNASAKKVRRWLNQPATSRQFSHLPQAYQQNYGLTRYHASCLLTFIWNKTNISQLVMEACV